MITQSKGKVFTLIRAGLLPSLLLVLAILLRYFYETIFKPYLPASVVKGIDIASFTVFAIIITALIQRIASGLIDWYSRNIADKTASKLDEELVPFLRRSISIIIWTFSILLVLPQYGVNTSALITVLGVSSLAISLAAKDTISNIIAGFLIMIDRPFRVNDKIKIPSGEVVHVLDIGIRRSTFKSDEGSVIVVPNLDLSKSKIVNYTYGEEIKP